MTTIISAVYGDYDTPKIALPQSVKVDYVMVTDRPDLRAPGWDVVHDPMWGGSARSKAKMPKLYPWRYADGPWIWIDASIELRSRHFARDMLASVTNFGMFEHPDRDCIYDEAAFSAHLPKYQDEPLYDQIACYRNRHHPEHWGLWAAGIIVWAEAIPDLSVPWLGEINRWTLQDQVSLPYVLRNQNMRPESLPHHLRSNPWFTIRPHRGVR